MSRRGTRRASLLAGLLAVVVMLASSALFAQAADPNATEIEAKAQALFQQNKFPEAFAAYNQCAETGSAVCQDWLGYMYTYGIGVTKDEIQGFEWTRAAAEQGLAIAEFNLGWKYQYGIGTMVDEGQVVDWYEKAAKQGQPYAENSLGYWYQKGFVNEIDYDVALAWYSKAAEQGYPNALANLGFMYLYGHGVLADRAKARALFEKAAAAGEVNALGFLEQMNAVELTSAQLQHATVAIISVPGYTVPAPDAAPLSAEEQDQVAQTMTAEDMYGLASLDTAALTKRASSGNPLVEYILAARYHDGSGAPKNKAQADALMNKVLPTFEHAAKLGNPLSEFILGDLCLEGVAYPKDTAKAIAHFREAALHGDVPAFRMLAYLYRDGLLGVKKDPAQSFYWFHMLASYGPNSGSVYRTLPDSFIFPTPDELIAKMAGVQVPVHGFSQMYVAPQVPVAGEFGLPANAPLPVMAKNTAWPQQPLPVAAPGTYGIPANGCVAEGRDSGGAITFNNDCSYRIHIIYAPIKPRGDEQPYYSVYLNPGQMIVTDYFNSHFKTYACDYNHMIIGPDGKPVTSVVDDFRCLKQ